jgi:hypothetical protein
MTDDMSLARDDRNNFTPLKSDALNFLGAGFGRGFLKQRPFIGTNPRITA